MSYIPPNIIIPKDEDQNNVNNNNNNQNSLQNSNQTQTKEKKVLDEEEKIFSLKDSKINNMNIQISENGQKNK